MPSFLAQLADDRLFLLEPVTETLGTVSESIAEGNKRVYAELAPLFAEFVRVFRDAGGGQAELDAFTSRLDPRDSQDGGQAPLITAFPSYFKAMSTNDPALKARHILLGNCLIGLHEQTRLQPQIAGGHGRADRRHHPQAFGAGRGRRLSHEAPRRRRASARRATSLAQHAWEEIATRTMMSLALPGGAVLPLGRDIPPTAASCDFLPQALVDVADPTELSALVKLYDRAKGDSDKGTRSIDWRLLADRMNFIVNLFRSRQQDLELLEPPFSADQRAVFEQRKMPNPSLGKL